MPELPDILLYQHVLSQRLIGAQLTRLRIISPFVLRTFDPPVEQVESQGVSAIERIGKRIVFALSNDARIVVHLMIAGRFRWSDQVGVKPPGKIALASFAFDRGTLHLVEPSQKKRAGIWLARDATEARSHDPGGLDVLHASTDAFAARLRSGNHTLKRALTDPRLFDGIGNAFSDEILHAARLSPLKLTGSLSDAQIVQLHDAARTTLQLWTTRLLKQFATKFPAPGDVTAFRPESAVHGKFGQACPVCGTRVQRIRYAENDCNYCPRCQTGGKLLADRSMSRLLKRDWPRSIDEWEAERGVAGPGTSPDD